MNYVEREKYESVKKKGSQWRERALQYKNSMEFLEEQLKTRLEKIDNLEKKLGNIEISHERDIMRKDIEIDRLKGYLNDVRERYKEIREDITVININVLVKKPKTQIKVRIIEIDFEPSNLSTNLPSFFIAR